MNELSQRLRKNVVETLELITDAQLQRRYQAQVPDVDVPAELFNQWKDNYGPSYADFRDAFDPEELEALAEFDSVLNDVSDETPQILPTLDVFLLTKEWQRMADAGRVALSRLKMR